MKSRNNLNRTVVILGCSSLLCASLTNVVLLDPTPLTHLEHAMELQAEDKLRAPLIVMTGGERPVDEAEIARSKVNEIARTGNNFDLSGKSVTTEFDLLRETAALKLGIADDEWQTLAVMTRPYHMIKDSIPNAALPGRARMAKKSSSPRHQCLMKIATPQMGLRVTARTPSIVF